MQAQEGWYNWRAKEKETIILDNLQQTVVFYSGGDDKKNPDLLPSNSTPRLTACVPELRLLNIFICEKYKMSEVPSNK